MDPGPSRCSCVPLECTMVGAGRSSCRKWNFTKAKTDPWAHTEEAGCTREIIVCIESGVKRELSKVAVGYRLVTTTHESDQPSNFPFLVFHLRLECSEQNLSYLPNVGQALTDGFAVTNFLLPILAFRSRIALHCICIFPRLCIGDSQRVHQFSFALPHSSI